MAARKLSPRIAVTNVVTNAAIGDIRQGTRNENDDLKQVTLSVYAQKNNSSSKHNNCHMSLISVSQLSFIQFTLIDSSQGLFDSFPQICASAANLIPWICRICLSYVCSLSLKLDVV